MIDWFTFQINGTKQIYFCSFSFLHCYLSPPPPPYVHWSISHHSPLPCPLFLPMIPSSPPWQYLSTSWIFPLCVVYRYPKTCPERLFTSLLSCFYLPPYLCIHSHPSASIYTHPWHFSSNRPEHNVRGNFPDHRTQILTCVTINTPHLSCSCIPCTLYPLDPNAPIYTHTHPFLSVCTRLFTIFPYIDVWFNKK